MGGFLVCSRRLAACVLTVQFLPMPSRTFRIVRGHLRVVHVDGDRRRVEKCHYVGR